MPAGPLRCRVTKWSGLPNTRASVAVTENGLDLYSERPGPDYPVVSFDQSPIAAKPGQRRHHDDEYRRHGTVSLFVCLDGHNPWRKVKVTERRASGRDLCAACGASCSDTEEATRHVPALWHTVHWRSGRPDIGFVGHGADLCGGSASGAVCVSAGAQCAGCGEPCPSSVEHGALLQGPTVLTIIC